MTAPATTGVHGNGRGVRDGRDARSEGEVGLVPALRFGADPFHRFSPAVRCQVEQSPMHRDHQFAANKLVGMDGEFRAIVVVRPRSAPMPIGTTNVVLVQWRMALIVG